MLTKSALELRANSDTAILSAPQSVVVAVLAQMRTVRKSLHSVRRSQVNPTEPTEISNCDKIDSIAGDVLEWLRVGWRDSRLFW